MVLNTLLVRVCLCVCLCVCVRARHGPGSFEARLLWKQHKPHKSVSDYSAVKSAEYLRELFMTAETMPATKYPIWSTQHSASQGIAILSF